MPLPSLCSLCHSPQHNSKARHASALIKFPAAPTLNLLLPSIQVNPDVRVSKTIRAEAMADDEETARRAKAYRDSIFRSLGVSFAGMGQHIGVSCVDVHPWHQCH